MVTLPLMTFTDEVFEDLSYSILGALPPEMYDEMDDDTKAKYIANWMLDQAKKEYKKVAMVDHLKKLVLNESLMDKEIT